MENLPGLESILHNGIQLQQEGKLDLAAAKYDQILDQIPHQIDACYFKALILITQEKWQSIIELIEPALSQSMPSSFANICAKLHRILGFAHQNLGYYQEAIENYQRAEFLDPENLDYQADHIQALILSGQLESAAHYTAPINWDSCKHQRLLVTLAELDWRTWKVADCNSKLQKALQLDARQLDVVSQYLLTSNYLDENDTISAGQHIELGQALSRLFQPSEASSSDATNQKPKASNDCAPLKIGFLSADLREHSVAYFLLPLLKELRKKQHIWTGAYALNSVLDEVSEKIKVECDQFISVNNPDLSEIKHDKVDILFDLTGHTSGNALSAILNHPKPAPILINWLGYANTMGFSSHDFRFVDAITDPVFDPPSNSVKQNTEPTSEERIRISPSFLCYEPPSGIPAPNRNLEKQPDICIGCLNNINKITDRTIKVWGEIFRKSEEHFVFLLKSPAFEAEYVRAILTEAFTKNGIPEDRLLLLPRTTDLHQHFDTYNQIDFTLDTFPYNGTTTTFESLMMGCPVITLQSASHRSRVGSSILQNLGHPEWIAKNEDEYIDQAITMIGSIHSLRRTRLELRKKLLGSTLCNSEHFATAFLDACMKCKNSVKRA